MAVGNSFAPQQANILPDKTMEYQVSGETVRLSPSMVRKYLVNGQGNVTDQEVAYFLNICKYQKLNPLIKECYLIKYSDKNPATIVMGKDAMLKRAMRNPKYAGQQAGVIVIDKTGELAYRNGALVLQGEQLVGGWAKVFVKGYEVPIEAAVSYAEYVQLKDGQPNSMWRGKPGTMIRKVALVQAMREAFPEDLGGLYDSTEMGVDIDEPGMPAPIDMDLPEPAPHTEAAPMPEELDPLPFDM